MKNTISNHRVSPGFIVVSRDVFYSSIHCPIRTSPFSSPNDAFETFTFEDKKGNKLGFLLVGRDDNGDYQKVYYIKKEVVCEESEYDLYPTFIRSK